MGEARLPTVHYFLCCLSLEIGGLVIGWISAIFSAFASITIVLLIVLVSVAYSYVDNLDQTVQHAALIFLIGKNFDCATK